jgi:hypothetical protein
VQDADQKPAAVNATCLPDDLGACHALILEQARALVAAQESREGLGQEVEELKAHVQRLLQQLYGRRRERVTFDPKEGVLDFGDDPAAADALVEAAAAAEKIIQEYTVRREVRKPRVEPRQEKFPEHFPRVEEVIEPPADRELYDIEDRAKGMAAEERQRPGCGGLSEGRARPTTVRLDRLRVAMPSRLETRAP